MSVTDWSETAKLVVEDSLGIKKGEKVLLMSGEGAAETEGICDLFSAVKEELFSRGLDPTMISYRSGRGVELPALVEEICCSADVIISIYVRGLLYTSAYPRIQKNIKPTARFLMLPDANDYDFMNRLMPKTKDEFYEVADLAARVGGQFLGGPHRVHLTHENGTDLTFTIGSLRGWNQTGYAKDPGSFAILPAGTLNVGVDEGSAEGVLVIDTYTALKPVPLKDKIIFEVHNGFATAVTGGEEAADFIAASKKFPGTDAEKYCIAEFGLGFSRVADYHVNQFDEGEYVYAASHIGIGSNASFGGSVLIPAWHTDSLLPGARVELDGEVIADQGQYLV